MFLSFSLTRAQYICALTQRECELVSRSPTVVRSFRLSLMDKCMMSDKYMKIPTVINEWQLNVNICVLSNIEMIK